MCLLIFVNSFFLLACGVVHSKKCWKKIYTCDCFLDIACTFLVVDDDFVSFKESVWKRENSKTYLFFVIWQREDFLNFNFVCCREFADFQIDLFVKTKTFPLKTISCNYKALENDELRLILTLTWLLIVNVMSIMKWLLLTILTLQFVCLEKDII